jgi:hypothetical protein
MNIVRVIYSNRIKFMIFFLITNCSCSLQASNNNEIVMCEGMSIEATNANGTISIKADEGLMRVFSWGNNSISEKLKARDKRWYGSYGAYSPGGGSDVHLIVEEGQQHFCSENEALEWLNWQNERMQYVYSSNGLVIGWYFVKDPNSSQSAVSIQLWQFYILGKKPTALQGAKNNQIKVSYKDNVLCESPKVGIFFPNNPKIIDGRLYSGKSIDYLTDAAVNISTDSIEDTIKNGEPNKEGEYITYMSYSSKGVIWVKLDRTGRVVLIGR